MPRNQPPPQETESSSLPALLTVAEAQLLTGQTLSTDDWQRLLDAGADAGTFYDLTRRSNRASLSTLGRLTQDLHRLQRPRNTVLMDMMKLALIGGMLEPHVLTLRVICAAPPPLQGQSGNVMVDSQVLSDLIEELYFNPDLPRPAAEVGVVHRGVEELYRNRKKLTVAGLDALKALRPRLKQKAHETQTS
ncbi:hypothetical protein [Deinococcus altitudinis]|uniref:hypothetical protein n=1 Tax=Deinococcus altitudinis TaxID=468914 RepID=UPI003891250C